MACLNALVCLRLAMKYNENQEVHYASTYQVENECTDDTDTSHEQNPVIQNTDDCEVIDECEKLDTDYDRHA